MQEHINSQILKSLFANYVIIQFGVLTISFLIWKKWIKTKRSLWTYATLTVLGFYVFYCWDLINGILTVEDLRIGGYTFAFEMMSLIGGGFFVGAIGLLAAITRSKIGENKNAPQHRV